MRPLGQGPEVLLSQWPPVPVLLLGPEGSGRRTWAEYLLRAHHAREAMTIRADAGLSADQARELRRWASIRARVPKWASVDLDATGEHVQNSLLKVLEEPPSGVRFLLRGQRRRVLETILSRSRVVRLTPSPVAEEVEFVEGACDCSREEAVQAVCAARGRPGMAVRLVGTGEIAQRGTSLVAAARTGDRVAVASGMADSSADWVAVRDWLHRWSAREALRGHVPMNVIAAARDVHEPRLAVRLALSRLADESDLARA